MKHDPRIQVILRAHPGGYSIAEENKVLKHDGSHVRGRPSQPPPCPLSPTARTCTTPPGLTPIIMQMPRKAESFSSLSRMFLRDVHLAMEEGSRSHPGRHTPRPDELLQHGCHLLWAHVAQAADGDGWNGRGTRQATCNPEWPRDGVSTLPGTMPSQPCLVLTCVFQQCLGRVGPVNDLHQIAEDHLHIGLHLCP
ncbi:rCG51207, isoform CRA_b [Rattus norvegicus]|uniref:RCG51207, isoform CRA_b n=1 Tax=Rattus norvegicus TaxID=10116 RepID=A6IY35_RAT|nr:rCG51207, isoform CRA_b [Rattus norvegicus]